jgi:hypothetical protein
MYVPGQPGPVVMVGTGTRTPVASVVGATSTAAASTTWEFANRAVYLPLLLNASLVARRVWWANGATTSGGATIEVGVYADSGYGPGAKLVGGSATQGTASQVQFVDVTDTSLPPGLYWIAITSSSATSTTIFRASVSTICNVRFQEESAYPLPSTATPVETSNGSLYLFGFATTASP